jgi:hypothetical protein
MVSEKREGWVRWRPEIAESTVWEDLAEAIADFEPPCNEAGEECAGWLKEQSLLDYPFTATWVLFHASRVHGFFAISSNILSIDYTNSPRESGVAKENWPCSQIKWLCKREGGKFRGATIFKQAAYTAKRVAMFQGNVALVIEPFDDPTAALLQERHEFLRTAEQGQLWLPLYRDEDLFVPQEPVTS